MPAIGDYLAPGEEVVASTTAADTEDRSETDTEGVIACSKERVVFSRDSYVADRSLRSVNSIEYRPPSPDKRLINGGLAALGIAASGWIAQNEPFLNFQNIEAMLGLIALFRSRGYHRRARQDSIDAKDSHAIKNVHVQLGQAQSGEYRARDQNIRAVG